MLTWLGKLGLCVGPLALSPLLLFLIADGYLDFGGGEKDVVLLLPWVLWSLAYATVYAVCWARNVSLRRAVGLAAGGATALLVAAGAGSLLWTQI